MTLKNDLKKKNQRLGRPPMDPEKTRDQRIVTFVTKRELFKLKRTAAQRKESLSAAVHRMISNSLSEETK